MAELTFVSWLMFLLKDIFFFWKSQVRLNDLAAPPEPLPPAQEHTQSLSLRHPLMLVESVVSLLIVANAIMHLVVSSRSCSPRMGFQLDPRWEDWQGWIYFEAPNVSR